LEAQTACRGWFVGLVKNRTKTNKRRQRRSRSRGLIDRDVFAVTPASGENVDSRLANWRGDRAGSGIDFVGARGAVGRRGLAWLLRMGRRINMEMFARLGARTGVQLPSPPVRSL